VQMGPNGESEFDIWQTSAAKVREIVAAVKN